ncbi:TPA: hypothetical protein ACH3X2_003922 [Trebouxia sp. C0005]
MATVQEERVDFVEFVIKNPARSTTPPFILRARASSTVSDLKKQLQAEYNGKPDPQTQTIIYAGKVLREESLLVKDFLRPRVDESALHPLHLVIKTDARPAQQSTPHAHPASSAGPSGYAPPPFQPRAAQQAPQGPQPQNAAMLAAYQAALNTFVNNRNPQQGGSLPQQQNSSAGPAPSTGSAPAGSQQQQPPHSQQAHPNAVPAAAHQQAGMYAMHAAPMLAYMPVLIPSPYAAMQQGWPQQQQQQHQQQAGTSGQGQAPMQGQAPVQYPYPPFMPMMVPYGMPPPMQGMPGPFRVHVAGPHHQGAPTTGPNAGLRQRHMARGPAGGGPGVAEGLPAGMFRLRRVPGMQVRMVRIDLKALVQMAVVALVLYQVAKKHCS